MNKLLLSFSCFFLLFFLAVKTVDAARLQFENSSYTLSSQEQKAIKIVLDPEGKSVIGVDCVITYDPSYLSVISVNKTNGFATKVGELIDNQTGELKFAFTNDINQYTKEKVSFSEIVVETKKPVNSTPLQFRFFIGETSDSNVAASGGIDVLTSVGNTNIGITSAISQNVLSSTNTPALTPVPLSSTLGDVKETNEEKTNNNKKASLSDKKVLSDEDQIEEISSVVAQGTPMILEGLSNEDTLEYESNNNILIILMIVSGLILLSIVLVTLFRSRMKGKW